MENVNVERQKLRKIAISELLQNKKEWHLIYNECFVSNAGYRVIDDEGRAVGYMDFRQVQKLLVNNIITKAHATYYTTYYNYNI